MHQHIILPNHIHGIIELTHVNQTVGYSDIETQNVGTRPVVSLHDGYQKNAFGKHISGSVSVIMQQYKSSVKRWCNKNECHYFQ